MRDFSFKMQDFSFKILDFSFKKSWVARAASQGLKPEKGLCPESGPNLMKQVFF